jgi:Uncharacterized protein conserved in bacteria (DUF2225)
MWPQRLGHSGLMNHLTHPGGIRMLKRRGGIWVFVLLILISSSATAATDTEVEVTCPIDGTKFMFKPDPVGVQTGIQLDLKPIGFLIVPRKIPVCPNNHFVVYKNQFTDTEKEHLKQFVLSKEYQDLALDNPSYFLVAKIYEHLGESEWDIAYAYLEASWQVEEKPEKYKQYIELSLQHLNKFLSTGQKEGDKTRETAQLLTGELERRLERFEEAKARFRELSQLPIFKQRFYSEIIKYQIGLISAKDSGPHDLPKPKN